VVADSERIPFPAEAVAVLRAAGLRVLLVDGHDADTIARLAAGAAVLFVRHGWWGAGELSSFRDLRVVARCGTGYDNIDVRAARARGVAVTYVPDYGADDVADQTLALALALLRRIAWGDRVVRRGEWPGAPEYGGVRRLRGRRVGIVGYGRIGRAVAARFAAFGADVVVHDPVPASGAHHVALDELLATSAVVCLTCPLTPATRGLLGVRELALLAHDAVVVNTARGELVDERALVDALTAGRIAGAALDVFASEPLEASSPLRALDNVVLAPHSAGFTDDAIHDVALVAARDAVAVLAGGEPRYPVP
jgi:phosphoglycerate dehydrogenase-like enzyme